MLYEYNNGYIPLRIKLRDVVGYYDGYNGNDKRMSFKINDELSDKICKKLENIFEHIEEKLSITLNDLKKLKKHFFKEKIKPNLILKEGKVTPKESDANFTPKENVMYTCRVLFQIQSVFFKIKDKKYDIIHYPQLLLDQ